MRGGAEGEDDGLGDAEAEAESCESESDEGLDEPADEPVRQPELVTNENMLFEVLKKLTAREVARCATICLAFRNAARSPLLWKRYSLRVHGSELALSIANKHPSWRWMHVFLTCPRLRVDGVFVSSNRYSKNGSTQTCCYYRYLRVFSSSNHCLYKITPLPPKKVIPYLADSIRATEDAHTFVGRVDRNKTGRKVHVTVKYGHGQEATFVHSYLYLNSTCPGAYNRLEVQHMLSVLERDAPDNDQMLHLEQEWHPPPEMRLQHKSAQTSYHFIPWDDATRTAFNDSRQVPMVYT